MYALPIISKYPTRFSLVSPKVSHPDDIYDINHRERQSSVGQASSFAHEKPPTKEIGTGDHAAYLADYSISVYPTTRFDEIYNQLIPSP